MITIFYFAVRLAVAVYLLWQLWIWLFRGGASKLIWDRMPVREVRAKVKTESEPGANRKATAVVGTTKVVILDDPKAGLPVVVATQDLEPTGYLGEDKGLSPDHFEGESLQGAYIPADEELYDEQEAIAGHNTEMEGGGVTFDELNEVVDVLTSKTAVDKERRIGAGKIVAKITNTTFYDILASEVGGMLTVSSLEQEYFTSEGEAIRSKVDKIEDIRFKEFDISIYT